VAILLFVAAVVVALLAFSAPIAYTAGRRRGRREVDLEARRDLLDRVERYALGNEDWERELGQTLLALLASPEAAPLPRPGWAPNAVAPRTQSFKPPPPPGRGSASHGR
jgi:hypothetical protein